LSLTLDAHEESNGAVITAVPITVNNRVTQCILEALGDHTVIQSPKMQQISAINQLV